MGVAHKLRSNGICIRERFVSGTSSRKLAITTNTDKTIQVANLIFVSGAKSSL